MHARDKPLPILRATTRRERLERARHIADWILGHYSDAVVAIGIYGSTARGSDEPYSDLEMSVLMRSSPTPGRDERYVQGLKISVEFHTVGSVYRRLQRVDLTWPLCVDQFVSVLSLYDPEGHWPKLKLLVDQLPSGSFVQAIREGIVGELLENFAKLENARKRDDAPAMRWIAWNLAWDVAMISALMNRACFTSWSRTPDEILRLPSLLPAVKSLVEKFRNGDLRSAKGLHRCCEAAVRGVVQHVATLGVHVQVEPSLAGPPREQIGGGGPGSKR